MVTRIEISLTVPDARIKIVSAKLKGYGYRASVVGVTDIYSIDKRLTKKNISSIIKLLTNPVVEKGEYLQPMHPSTFDWAIEIGYLPGVTDNIASTAREIVTDRLHTKFSGSENIYSSIVYFIKGKLSEASIRRISEALYNPVIQRVTIKSQRRFMQDKGMGLVVPRVSLSASQVADTVNLNVPDRELAAIGKSGIINSDGSRRGPLALSLSAMKEIAKYFARKKRNPTDVELESIAQTWSEHCKHIVFNSPIDDIPEGLFRRYIKRATDEIRAKKGENDFCVSVFSDNSGAIRFDRTFLLTHKVETHNSPSALDPFGGSVTGIVGVNRDAIGFGLGAKPVLNTYGFCLSDPSLDVPLYKGANKTQPMLSARRIFDGVVAGVNTGGNCSGIPTPQGFLYFDQRYRGKPLVFVGTVGLIPDTIGGKKSYVKKARPGDYIVMVGGRVGLDGIHGATFSSEALTSGSPATAVQIGDPITQKKLSDAIIKEARAQGLYTSITDNGAGGLSCSVAEMAKESGGCLLYLDRVPVKYPGLAPWQIWVSESQERMTVAVPKKFWKRFSSLMQSRGVEATVLGTFTRSGRCEVQYKKKPVMDVDMHFLHDGFPREQLHSKPVVRKHPEPDFHQKSNYTTEFLQLIGRKNIAGYSFLSQQYDHEVQGSSVTKPLQGAGRVNADATVSRPVLSSQKGIALSFGLAPSYGDIDIYAAAAASIDTAVRACVVAGSDPDRIAILDNFCWCQGRDPERLYELKQAARACYDTAIAYQAPFISGKDSMYNDFVGFDASDKPVSISIPPTVLISAIGILDDCASAVTLDAKIAGDLVYVLGGTFDELGGSEWYAQFGAVGNNIPRVLAAQNVRLYRTYYKLVKHNLLVSGQSVGRGGLAVTLAKIALGGLLGMDLILPTLPGKASSAEVSLFSESQGRVVVTVAPYNKKAFERALADIPFAYLGMVTKAGIFSIKNSQGFALISTPINRVLSAYRAVFATY